MLAVEKQGKALGEIETWASTIHSNSEKILKKARGARERLAGEVETLRSHLGAL